jgi:ribosome-binding factor A
MSQTNKRLSDLVQQLVAEMVQRVVEFPDGLITISFIDLSGDGQEAKIGVSVLPVKLYGTALRQLRKKSVVIAQTIAKKCHLARVPKLIWLIDDTAELAAHLDKIMDQLS